MVGMPSAIFLLPTQPVISSRQRHRAANSTVGARIVILPAVANGVSPMRVPLQFRLLGRLALMLTCVGVDFSRAADSSDATLAITTNQSLLPAAVDLRPKFEAWQLSPRRQGARPTCSVFTYIGALEFAAASQTHHGELFSVDFLNWAANQTRQNRRDGGFFSDFERGFARFGVCREDLMPYTSKFEPARKPEAAAQMDAQQKLDLGLRAHWIKRWNPTTGLSDAELVRLKKTLAAGWPVCGGFRWPQRERWQAGVLQMCPPDQVFDGHSLLLVGYRDGAKPDEGVLLFRNSDGPSRDGQMPYEYARAYMNDALWIQPEPASSRADAK